MTGSLGLPFEVLRTVKIQGYDIDYAGVVSNIVYVRWLEDLRMTILENHFPLQPQLEQGFSPVVLSTHIHYKRSFKLFDQPLGRMWLKELGRTRWVLQAEFTADDILYAQAEQTGCFLSLRTWKPMPVPPAFRQIYEQFPRSQS